MGAVYAQDGTLLYVHYPTWDAHHYAIEHRTGWSDEEWAGYIADPDWTDHAREDLRNGRVCDGCLIDVACGFGTGGAAARSAAQEELTRRGVSWLRDEGSDDW